MELVARWEGVRKAGGAEDQAGGKQLVVSICNFFGLWGGSRSLAGRCV